MNHLSVTFYHREISTSRINSRRSLSALPVAESNSQQSQSGEEQIHLLHQCKPCFNIQMFSSSDKTAAVAASRVTSLRVAIAYKLQS